MVAGTSEVHRRIPVAFIALTSETIHGERRRANSGSWMDRSSIASSVPRLKSTASDGCFAAIRRTLGTVIQFSEFHTPTGSPVRVSAIIRARSIRSVSFFVPRVGKLK